MANICIYWLYLSTTDRNLRNTLMQSIEKLFDCYDLRQSDTGEVLDCEIKFDLRRWFFPYKEMENLTKGIPQESNLYICVRSFESDSEHIGFNSYINGEWHEKIAYY